MIREQMRRAIDDGIQGFIQAAFAGGKTQPCAVTGYPLTADNSAVRYVSQYAYEAIEKTFLDYFQWDETAPMNNDQKQIWVAYFWQHARLEFVEVFAPCEPPSDETGNKYRAEMKAMGYTRVTDASGKETML